MATRAITNEEYVIDQDSSSSFQSSAIDLTLPLQAINYQAKWTAGVSGTLTWQAAIYEDLWETLVACEAVDLEITGSEPVKNSIVALPYSWLTMGYIRVIWVPSGGGSTGNINVAIRIVPI